jgi:hypothetical protein
MASPENSASAPSTPSRLVPDIKPIYNAMTAPVTEKRILPELACVVAQKTQPQRRMIIKKQAAEATCL